MFTKKKTIKLLIVVIIFGTFLFAGGVSATKYTAGDSTKLLGQTVEKTGVSETDVNVILKRVLKSAIALVGLLFFILAFYGGFSWLIARGNEEQITKAKGTVIASIIGLVVIISSYAITNFVFGSLVGGGAGGGSSVDIPDAVEGEDQGCCLDKWATEGGYFGVGQSGWTGTLLTKAQCGVLINAPDYPGQKIGSDWGDWVGGITEIGSCQDAAKLKDVQEPESDALDFSGDVEVPDSGADSTQASSQSQKKSYISEEDSSALCCNEGFSACVDGGKAETYCKSEFSCIDGKCE